MAYFGTLDIPEEACTTLIRFPATEEFLYGITFPSRFIRNIFLNIKGALRGQDPRPQ